MEKAERNLVSCPPLRIAVDTEFGYIANHVAEKVKNAPEEYKIYPKKMLPISKRRKKANRGKNGSYAARTDARGKADD